MKNYIRKKQLRLSVFSVTQRFPFHKHFSKRVRAFTERAVPSFSSSTHQDAEHQLIQVLTRRGQKINRMEKEIDINISQQEYG